MSQDGRVGTTVLRHPLPLPGPKADRYLYGWIAARTAAEGRRLRVRRSGGSVIPVYQQVMNHYLSIYGRYITLYRATDPKVLSTDRPHMGCHMPTDARGGMYCTYMFVQPCLR